MPRVPPGLNPWSLSPGRPLGRPPREELQGPRLRPEQDERHILVPGPDGMEAEPQGVGWGDQVCTARGQLDGQPAPLHLRVCGGGGQGGGQVACPCCKCPSLSGRPLGPLGPFLLPLPSLPPSAPPVSGPGSVLCWPRSGEGGTVLGPPPRPGFAPASQHQPRPLRWWAMGRSLPVPRVTVLSWVPGGLGRCGPGLGTPLPLTWPLSSAPAGRVPPRDTRTLIPVPGPSWDPTRLGYLLGIKAWLYGHLF